MGDQQTPNPAPAGCTSAFVDGASSLGPVKRPNFSAAPGLQRAEATSSSLCPFDLATGPRPSPRAARAAGHLEVVQVAVQRAATVYSAAWRACSRQRPARNDGRCRARRRRCPPSHTHNSHHRLLPATTACVDADRSSCIDNRFGRLKPIRDRPQLLFGERGSRKPGTEPDWFQGRAHRRLPVDRLRPQVFAPLAVCTPAALRAGEQRQVERPRRQSAAEPEGDVDEGDEDGHLDHGPTTPASASPDAAPKTPTATAIASSKSFEATVKESAAVCSKGSPRPARADPVTHIAAKYTSSGSALRATSVAPT